VRASLTWCPVDDVRVLRRAAFVAVVQITEVRNGDVNRAGIIGEPLM
jgi:hypothetical protein